MKYNTFIFRGHSNKTIGAVANGYREFEVAQQIVNRVVQGLKNNGWNVHSNSIEQDNFDCDLTNGNTYSCSGFTIHLNAGGGTGCEIIKSFKGNRFTREFNILHRLENEVGLKNRGVKSKGFYSEKTYQRSGLDNITVENDWYREIRNAKDNGNDLGILEIGFIDNKEDITKIVNNIDKIANIIIEEYLK